MAKDPAFLFYTSDFLTGTLTMTDEQVGKYIRLLCLQHQKGALSEKDMLFICKSYDEDIFCKFVKSESGYFNQRLKDESEKRANYSLSRSNNRKKKEDIKNICKTYDEHMENENENINEDEIVLKKIAQFPIFETPFELTETEINAAKEINNRQTGQIPTEKDVGNWLYIFKQVNFTGQKFYENRTEIVKHFKNWVKSQKLQSNGSTTNNYAGTNGTAKKGTSEARTDRAKVW
jgi:hypothetical protein